MVTEVEKFADKIIQKLKEIEKEPVYQHEDEDWLTGLIIAEDIINDELESYKK